MIESFKHLAERGEDVEFESSTSRRYTVKMVSVEEIKDILNQKTINRRISREERLRSLGFEDLSDDERREQLARNIAMRDWPKI